MTTLSATSTAPQQTRANSFNYLRTTISVPYRSDVLTCPAYRAVRAADLHRQLWLIEGERLVLYATDSGDFSADEIRRIKDEHSHLLLDRAPLGVLDDFVDGMRRVLPDPSCDACPNRRRCGRRFAIVDQPPFAAEEAWIGDFISNLRGCVLDVGCGEQLYRDRLAPLLRQGFVHYTGLDPDEPSLAKIRHELPEGEFRLGGIEDFDSPSASYDVILSLRSLNHVYDLALAVRRMADVLRPGGQLLVVEMTPFAMLRRAQQIKAADRAPRAGHQHFRNLTSEELLPVAEPAFRVLYHRAAARQTSNQWILLLQRS